MESEEGTHATNLRRNRSRSSGCVSREDWWSEGATSTLIGAWGERYVVLKHGNLRRKDWKEVVETVNARLNGVERSKTDIQCRNRIDTLKKKYKIERAKPSPSNWLFFHRLDSLIGANADKKVTPSVLTGLRRTAVKFSRNKLDPYRNDNPNPNRVSVLISGGSSSRSRLNSGGSRRSSLGGFVEIYDDDDDDMAPTGCVRKHQRRAVGFSEKWVCRELARTVVKFGEMYERIESSKQEQMMALEKQRMVFTRDLEVQWMNMLMEAQLQLEKIKRPKCAHLTIGEKL